LGSAALAVRTLRRKQKLWLHRTAAIDA